MTVEEAKAYGRNQALIKTAIVVALLLLVFMYQQTQGDFANGLLFFMQAILSVRFIGILVILFGLTFIFGKRAGKAIISDRKNFVPVAIKYAVILVLAITVPSFALTILSGLALTDLQEFFVAFVLGTLLWTIPLLLIWLWAGYKMRLAGQKDQAANSGTENHG